MKTASLPSVRVEPEVRDEAENVLLPGETLSSFVEESVRKQTARRRNQQEFIARGLASRDAALKSGVYFDAFEVLDELDSMYKKKTGALD